MVAEWWVEKNPEFKTIDRGAEWLGGFCDQLTREELHPADWSHLEELKDWQREQRELMDNGYPIAGPSTRQNHM